MTPLILAPENRAQLVQWLDEGHWVVACLCAAWCDTCQTYRSAFGELASRHPDKRFVWIDIEDESDIVGDIDVENFPTLLIQRSDSVAFFGPVLPDTKLADRLITAQTARNEAEMDHAAQATCNLRLRLAESER